MPDDELQDLCEALRECGLNIPEVASVHELVIAIKASSGCSNGGNQGTDDYSDPTSILDNKNPAMSMSALRTRARSTKTTNAGVKATAALFKSMLPLRTKPN